jgi:NADH dehydrogenase
VFVVGDLAGAADGKGWLLPQVAQPAIQQARHAARNIERTLKGEPRTPFEYKDKGTMATIGRNAAVTELPSGARFKGPLAWYMWLVLHLAYIVGFRIIVAVEPNPPPVLAPPRPAAQPASAPPRR